MMSEEYENLDYEDYEDAPFEEELDEDHTQTNTSNNPVARLYKKGSTIFVTIDDINQLIRQKCKDISELLGVSDDEAIILYTYFNWRKDRVEGEYFGDEERIRKLAGLEPTTVEPEPTTSEILCPMCFETKPKTEFEALKCRHFLCKDCWKEYIEYNVTRPENIFFWKCPTQGCNLILPNHFNLNYIEKDQVTTYYRKMARAYADNSKSLRWCPAPDCDYGAEGENAGTKGVECLCGWMYCFKCGLEDHRPCDCDIAGEWVKKDEGGGANAKWLLVNTKDCPKCKKPIEKNQGCNYMRCRHPGCNFEFCWLCCSDWKTHNDHFKCNKYDALSKDEKSKMDSEEQAKRSELQKYAFYYERYLNNAQAIESIHKIMKNIKKEEKDIALNLSLTLIQLDFLEKACQVVRNSKRTLKWSYAYGFYLTNELQRNLYEIIQQNLDMYSSELHVLLEKDYEVAKKNIGDFTKYKDKVLACVFKCKQSSEAFLEKMEEFETSILEEELKSKMESEEPAAKTKKRNYRKRMSSNISGGDKNEGHVRKSTKITKN